MILFDYHTHNQASPAGRAVINLPREVVEEPSAFLPRVGALYSVGVHPWWTAGDCRALWHGVEQLAVHPQVVAIGETGFDRLRGGSLNEQERWFALHAELATTLGKRLILHVVRAYDVLLAWRKRFPLRETSPWLVHGFRGNPELARQLLDAGLELSIGAHFNADTLLMLQPEQVKLETDDSGQPIEDICRKVRALRPDL